MPLETIPLLGPSQESRSFKVNPQRSINMFAGVERPGAKSSVVLYPTPGLSLAGTPTSGTTRSNGVKWNSAEYFVVGSSLVKIETGDVMTVYSGFLTSSGRCVIARGRDYLMIVDGTYGYSFNGTLSQITDADFPSGPTHCDYLDGYFIANKADSDSYYISASEDPTSWDALDTSRALGRPDDIVALAATSKDLYFFGDSSLEIHFNSGNPDFPFEVYPGGIVEAGIIAPYSLVKSGTSGLICLAGNDDGDAVIARIIGFQLEPLSDADLNYQINSLDTITDAFGMVHRRHGRTFYTITFPTADKTFEFEVEGRTWHERKSDGIGRWRGSGIGYLHPTYYVGDYDSGKIFKFSDTTYTEDGDTISRERYTQVVHFSNRRFVTHELVIDVESGTGLVTGQGSDPQVMLQYSDDGGNTWSSEIWRSIGKIGEYGTRVVFEKLGASRGRIFYWKLTDPVKFVIVGAYARIEVMND